MAGRLPAASSSKLPRALVLLSALALFSASFLSIRSLRPTAAPSLSDAQSFSPNPAAAASEVYHSPAAFSAGYAEMERSFRVFVYPDGDPGTFYQTPRKLTGKYASEGYFFQNIRESRFRTDDPDQAHLFFVPISPHKMRGKLCRVLLVQNYVESLINKYRYWNRTLGADHFFVTCHDVGVRAFEGLPFIIKNSIRVSYRRLVYQKQFYRTKFCVCPGGSQVNSARISDSIHYGCVPVILSDYYDLPFSGILNWRKFAVVLKESDVYELKSILKSLSQEEFVSLHKSLVQVQKHFEWHSPPVPYDAFHMTMYELWLWHHVIKY
uniref:Exostosin GT47 domain-containing protein n=1 Tax=Oryza meridionalis TaxID=40149 RepID=A0A0E0E448_9ORYZ